MNDDIKLKLDISRGKELGIRLHCSKSGPAELGVQGCHTLLAPPIFLRERLKISLWILLLFMSHKRHAPHLILAPRTGRVK